jgi:D-ribose pyranase
VEVRVLSRALLLIFQLAAMPGLLVAIRASSRKARAMLQAGILNPGVLDLVARIRHTNTLVIADWAFPYWPQIETVDISLCKGIPTVLDVLDLLSPVFKIGHIWQAEEFLSHNGKETVARFGKSFGTIPLTREPHIDFKKRVPHAIGLIRTGDSTAYGNIILESA